MDLTQVQKVATLVHCFVQLLRIEVEQMSVLETFCMFGCSDFYNVYENHKIYIYSLLKSLMGNNFSKIHTD